MTLRRCENAVAVREQESLKGKYFHSGKKNIPV